MQHKLLFFFLIITAQLPAQNLSGIWHGSFISPSGTASKKDNYKFEMQMDASSDTIFGVTHLTAKTRSTNYYIQTNVTGYWDTINKQFVLQEQEIVKAERVKIAALEKLTYYLTYSKTNGEEVLVGNLITMSVKDSTDYKGGMVKFTKASATLFKKEPLFSKANMLNKRAIAQNRNVNTNNAKKPVSKASNAQEIKITPPSVLVERKNDVAQTIKVDAENIEIKFYDNGEIDGDSISVYVNGKLILKNQGLSYEPINLSLKKSELGAINDVVMVAENLGTIPPNSATMIVYVGNKRYEVSLESTNQKNAVVRFEK
jgi:hypothetical protein